MGFIHLPSKAVNSPLRGTWFSPIVSNAAHNAKPWVLVLTISPRYAKVKGFVFPVCWISWEYNFSNFPLGE